MGGARPRCMRSRTGPLYRGEIGWNKTRKRDAEGKTAVSQRPEAEWLRLDRLDLRIVSDEVWTAAHARLGKLRTQLASAPGSRSGGSPT